MERIGLHLFYSLHYYVRRKISSSSPKCILMGGEGQRMSVVLEEATPPVSFLEDHENVFRSLYC